MPGVCTYRYLCIPEGPLCSTKDSYRILFSNKAPPSHPVKNAHLSKLPQGRVFVVRYFYGAHSTRFWQNFSIKKKFSKNINFFGKIFWVSTFTKGIIFLKKVDFRNFSKIFQNFLKFGQNRVFVVWSSYGAHSIRNWPYFAFITK